MKLTKGKISKLYNKKKQSLKKKVNKRKTSNKNKTFRKKRNIHLARKSLKRFHYKKSRGGAEGDTNLSQETMPKVDELSNSVIENAGLPPTSMEPENAGLPPTSMEQANVNQPMDLPPTSMEQANINQPMDLPPTSMETENVEQPMDLPPTSMEPENVEQPPTSMEPENVEQPPTSMEPENANQPVNLTATEGRGFLKIGGKIAQDKRMTKEAFNILIQEMVPLEGNLCPQKGQMSDPFNNQIMPDLSCTGLKF
jgi:hypothetical protein